MIFSSSSDRSSQFSIRSCVEISFRFFLSSAGLSICRYSFMDSSVVIRK